MSLSRHIACAYFRKFTAFTLLGVIMYISLVNEGTNNSDILTKIYRLRTSSVGFKDDGSMTADDLLEALEPIINRIAISGVFNAMSMALTCVDVGSCVKIFDFTKGESGLIFFTSCISTNSLDTRPSNILPSAGLADSAPTVTISYFQKMYLFIYRKVV